MSCVIVMVVISILCKWPPVQCCVIEVDVIPAMYSIDSFVLLVSDATF